MSNNCTTRIKLPYIMQSQSQKEVTHNESLEIIDMLLHPIAIAIEKNDPPDSPKDGDSYIVGSSPQGAWKEHQHSLVFFDGESWRVTKAFEGLTVWVREKKQRYIFDGKKWIPMTEISR